jgi:hypothetical protein
MFATEFSPVVGKVRKRQGWVSHEDISHGCLAYDYILSPAQGLAHSRHSVRGFE